MNLTGQDGRDLIPESRVLITEGSRREVNKLFKVGDTYYHFFSEVGDCGRYVMMQRAKSISGPYTEKHQLSRCGCAPSGTRGHQRLAHDI